MTENPILDKIAKLYAKATATDSEQEAQAFMDKVHALMLEHNLEMSSIKSHKVKGKDTITENRFNIADYSSKVEGEWVSKLIFNIARAFLARAIKQRWGKNATDSTMIIIGREENLPVIIGMIEYLIPTIKRVEKKTWSEYTGIQKRGAYRRDFLMACGLRVTQRLKENMIKAEQENNKVTALIRVHDAAVGDYMGDKYPNLISSKPTKLKLRDGHHAGSLAGNSINLSSQISSASSNKRLG